MTMKVIFEKGSYKLIGAQIAGYDGVDKRIDVLAASMYAGITALQLKELDLAYAPPYSSAKD
ncbi:dehydrogenase, partial [Acinetobacter pittii]|nr:dehydrogenase [Acinetobacter pittii]